MTSKKTTTPGYNFTPRGRAHRAWYNIVDRAGNANGKSPAYADVELRMTQTEFLAWAVPEYSRWMKRNPEKIPSIDRRNQDGHYELGNIRIIEFAKNSRRKKWNKNVNAPTGQAWCCDCKSYKLKEDFCKDKTSFHGVSYICRSCAKVRSERKKGPDWKPKLSSRQLSPEGQSWCATCKAYKPVAEFTKNRRVSNGLSHMCKPCCNEHQKKMRAKAKLQG